MTDTKVKKQEQNKPTPKDFIIRHNELRLWEFSNNFWKVVVSKDCEPQDLENHSVWSAVSNDLSPYDSIKAIAADGSWIADLLVMDALPTYARVKVLSVVNLPPRLSSEAQVIPAGYQVRRADPADPQGGWIAERISDGLVMVQGRPDYESARRALVDHAIFRNDTQTKYI